MSNKVTRSPNKPEDIRVSCRVPRQLRTRVRRIARTNGIDVSDVVRMALNRGLLAYEAPQSESREAVAA